MVTAQILKKYHQDLVFNYSEYPTKDHWSFDMRGKDLQSALLSWLPQNADKKIFFYVHIPFCERLCWFCTCSKYITQDYSRVSEYLSYLYREIDLLRDFLEKNSLSLAVETVFIGGGSPTILRREDLTNLVSRLRTLFDWEQVKFFTIESDPRHVDEDGLLYNHRELGANRISFGMQDLDPDVQRRVNRPQPVELFDSILTDAVRSCYKEIAVDFLIGQPGQTRQTMERTCRELVRLRPTLIQLSLMAFKPWVAKYQLQMLAEGPLPDFYERKALLDVIHEVLVPGGYVRTGFECYSLPDSPMTEAFSNGDAHYGASGHQPGARVNFLAVGSSAMSNLGYDYYFQNFYDLDSYKKSIDMGVPPVFRGLKLSADDAIRQYVTQQIRCFFMVDFKDLYEKFEVKFLDYFGDEVKALGEFRNDGLVEISADSLNLTELGRDFVQAIMNVFDAYDPPARSMSERLAVIKVAKERQSEIQKELSDRVNN